METLSDTFLDSIIIFENISDKIDKLKEWKLLSPQAKDIKDIFYKNNNGTYKCEIIGYLSKPTNPGCFTKSYETAVIKFDDKIVKIAPAYLLEMQKKDFKVGFSCEIIEE